MACRHCNSAVAQSGGSKAISPQRTAAAAPAANSTLPAPHLARIGPETAKRPISAMTPSAHSAPMVPSAKRLRAPMQRVESVVEGVARLDQARREQEQQERRRMRELGGVGEADTAKRWRAWRSTARDVARQEVDASNHQRRCSHQQRENGSGAILTDDQAAGEARQ